MKKDGDFGPTQEDRVKGILGPRPSTASKLPCGLRQVLTSFWASVVTPA